MIRILKEIAGSSWPLLLTAIAFFAIGGVLIYISSPEEKGFSYLLKTLNYIKDARLYFFLAACALLAIPIYIAGKLIAGVFAGTLARALESGLEKIAKETSDAISGVVRGASSKTIVRWLDSEDWEQGELREIGEAAFRGVYGLEPDSEAWRYFSFVEGEYLSRAMDDVKVFRRNYRNSVQLRNMLISGDSENWKENYVRWVREARFQACSIEDGVNYTFQAFTTCVVDEGLLEEVLSITDLKMEFLERRSRKWVKHGQSVSLDDFRQQLIDNVGELKNRGELEIDDVAVSFRERELTIRIRKEMVLQRTPIQVQIQEDSCVRFDDNCYLISSFLPTKGFEVEIEILPELEGWRLAHPISLLGDLPEAEHVVPEDRSATKERYASDEWLMPGVIAFLDWRYPTSYMPGRLAQES